MLKKMLKSLIVFSVLLSAINLLALTPTTYQQEFDRLKKNDKYNLLFNRQADSLARGLRVNIENAKEVGFIGRLFRAELLAQGGVVVTAQHMPKLYSYAARVCEQCNMRMPTILITKDKMIDKTIVGIATSSATDYTDSTKLLMSSGALLIGQDLLHEVSDKALEAAIAYEICCIWYNHQNKNILINFTAPLIASAIVYKALPSTWQHKELLIAPITFLLPRIIIGKLFEKQADRFVYETMGNGAGFIELCTYWREKEAKVDTDYDDVYTNLQESNISVLDFVLNGYSYFLSRTGHRLFKLYRWIERVTPLGAHQQYQKRIDNALAFMSK